MMQPNEISTKDEFLFVTGTLLNKDSTNNDREKADQLLAQLYKNVKAWMICREVLAEPNTMEQINFTAAKMLRVKMMYYFNELPEENYTELFEFLISNLI
jgi:hypothetical protein